MTSTDAMTRRYIIMVLAGSVGGRHCWRPWLHQVALHEARHAVTGRALWMRLGGVSIAPDDTSSGRAIVTFGAPPEASAVANLTPMTDRRAAIEAAAREWGGGWQETRRRVKHLRLLAFDMVEAHGDVIEAFAEVLVKRGVTGRDETESVIDGCEDRLNKRVIAGLLSSDPLRARNTPPQTLARVLAASQKLASHDGLTAAGRARWARIAKAGEAEVRRRSPNNEWLARLGETQVRAVSRLVDQAIESSQ